MKKTIITIFSIFTLCFGVFAQKNNVEKLIQEGVELHDKAEFKEAIKKFEQALKINPKSAQAIYEISLSYLELKDYKNAARFSTRVINSNDKILSPLAYAVKSEALAEMNQIDEAVKLLEEALSKSGDSYLLHFNLALNYYKKGNLDKTIDHVSRAIELNKSSSGAYLLYAYAQKDKGLWVKSIYSFQMFLLLEPDSQRSKNAFEEMLQTMLIKPATGKPVERSFIQRQLAGNKPESAINPLLLPPLSLEDGLNRNLVYHAITKTLETLKAEKKDTDIFLTFKEVNKAIIEVLDKNPDTIKDTKFWAFHSSFFNRLLTSKHYEAFCRYISVSYFPESYEWWENNQAEAESFIHWFEKGDSDPIN